MIAAVAFIAVLVIGFVLLYVSMMRSDSEHKSAIEAAAIAAAKDISKIVINTDEWGFVALTTEPPIGTDTNAPDDYYQDVHSINELMGTARLNLIIANEMGDQFLRDLSLADLSNVIQAKNQLTTALQTALSGGSGKDAAGNTITPLTSAQQAYMKNQAKGSSYVPGSLNLTLGGIEGGIPTSTPVPKPISKAQVAGKEVEGLYLSDTVVPYNGTDFVFGSVGKRVALCDKSKFRTTVPGLPFQVPAVVRAQAQQQFQDQGKTWTTTFVACACAGSLEPPRPAPGALTISFPDGQFPEMANPGDVLNHGSMQGAQMDIYTSQNGDFILDAPAATLGPYPYTIPFPSNPPTA